MRILYMHQYFATRKSYTGTRSYEFARYLIAKGHEVTMITSGRFNDQFPVPAGRGYTETLTEGIRVVPIDAAYNDPLVGTGMPGWKRMLEFLSFARLAGKVGRRLARPDVVFATHTPLPIGLAGMKVARHFRVPFVFEVRDVWPDALVNCGALTNPLGIWYLRRMARRIYAAATHIVALSPGMKRSIVRAGVAGNRITVIPNASDLDLFHPGLDGSAVRRRLGLQDRFTAVYFGAMGLANGLEYVVEAARVLARRGNRRIVIVLHGGGGRRARLEKLVRDCGLDNVVFSDPVPDKADVARIAAASDVCMTIYRACREQSWSPNKMFDSLAAGKPVVVNVPGWLKETVEGNACGVFVDPAEAESLAEALENLAANPQLCRTMGANARALAERQFDRRKLAGRLEQVLLAAVAGHCR